MTSSAISSTPCRSQISRSACQYPSGGTTAPAAEPTTGSAMNAATVSGPSASISRSTSAAHPISQLGKVAPSGQCAQRQGGALGRSISSGPIGPRRLVCPPTASVERVAPW